MNFLYICGPQNITRFYRARSIVWTYVVMSKVHVAISSLGCLDPQMRCMYMYTSKYFLNSVLVLR